MQPPAGTSQRRNRAQLPASAPRPSSHLQARVVGHVLPPLPLQQQLNHRVPPRLDAQLRRRVVGHKVGAAVAGGGGHGRKAAQAVKRRQGLDGGAEGQVGGRKVGQVLLPGGVAGGLQGRQGQGGAGVAA